MYFSRYSTAAVLLQPHGQGDPFLCQINLKHLNIYDISNTDSLEGMLNKPVGNLGNMHQAILMNPNVHKHTKINDVPNGSLDRKSTRLNSSH